MQDKIVTKVSEWYTCKNGPWYPNLKSGGFIAYRIWQQNVGHLWWQRHEWKFKDGSTEMENWIIGVREWCIGAKPVELVS